MKEPHLASAEFGGFRVRFLALLTDSAIVFLVVALIIAGSDRALGDAGVPTALVAAVLFAFLYWPVMHASALQGTLGKAMLGMRLTDYQGRRIGFVRALGRELAKVLSGAVLLTGYLLAAFTARNQALHDFVASTYVVREGKAHVAAALVTMSVAFVLPVVALPMVVSGGSLNALLAMASEVKQALPQLAAKALSHAQRMATSTPTPTPAPTPAPPPALVAEVPKAAPEAPQPGVQVAEPEPAEALEPPSPVPAESSPAPSSVTESSPTPSAAKVATKKAARRTAAVAKAPPVSRQKPAGPKYNDLATAVLYRDAQAVSELLKLGRWADKPDSQGATPLMLAVRFGDAGSAEALLRAGADASRALPVAQARGDGSMLELLKRYTVR